MGISYTPIPLSLQIGPKEFGNEAVGNFLVFKEKYEESTCSFGDILKQTDPLIFPNIFTMLKILALPVTTCSCERSVSVLRRMKTYLRTTMTQ